MKKPRRIQPKVVKNQKKKRMVTLLTVSLVAIALVAYCSKKDEPVSAPVQSPVAAAIEGSAPPVEAVAEPSATTEVTAEADRDTPKAMPGVTVWFKSPMIRSEPGIVALAEGNNANGEPLSFEFLWQVNGQVLSDVTGATLPWDRVRRGDRVVARVTPMDGDILGMAFNTNQIMIPNSPPGFVSVPMLNFKSEEYVYEAKADDADGDSLTYSLEKGPVGMVIDGSTGRVVWRVGREQAGEHVISIVVTDGQGGRAEQIYQLSISIP